MKILKKISFLFLLLFARFALYAQSLERFNSFSYSVNEGLLQSTIVDMAFDDNNFCWISFPNGIQKFDGKNFTAVPVPPGLPDDKLVRFFRCNRGDLLISYAGGISKYEINNNRFVQIFNFRLGEKKPVKFIGEDEDIVYFYSDAGVITGIDSHTFKVIKEIKPGLPISLNVDYVTNLSSNIINHKVVFQVMSRLFLWDLKKDKLVSQSISIPFISLIMLRLKTENEVLYCPFKYTNDLQLYNFTSNTIHTVYIKGKDDKAITRCNVFQWNDKTLISFGNKLYETDSTLQLLKAEIVNFQNQSIAGISPITQIKQDNFGNLYILTITDGIKKVIRNNYRIKYYGNEKKGENFILSVLPDKVNNKILAGTSGNGLLVFDTLQHLIKHIKTLPGERQPFSINTIVKTSKGTYRLFIPGERKVWEISNDLSAISSISISSNLPDDKSGIQYFGNFLFQNNQQAFIQSQGFLYKMNFTSNTIREHEFTASYTMSGLFYNNIIISHTNDELIFLDTSAFKQIKRIPFKNTGGVRCFVKDASAIYMGSNKGIFKIDTTGKILWHLTKENGLPDECIYAMCFDNNGFLWCSTNKGIFKVNKDNSLLQLQKEDGLQENEFNTNVVAKTTDGEIFFGGVNGISSFYPSAINSFEEKINLLVTRIKINNEEAFKDTGVWNIAKISLPYYQNSLSFDFIAMSGSNPSQYVYQYKMEGIDKEWIQNDGLQTIRYFLPPGDYIFQVYASRFFNKNAKPVKEIRITIHPPFWKSWWFITSLIAVFVFSIIIGINRFNKKKFEKKIREFEAEQKIKLEREHMSRDLHDSLGAYANAVLYKTELLEQEQNSNERNALIKELRFASKDIITSLRETIWALKKDNYTAEDCILRIRNFVQPFTRYYEHIQFKVEGEVPQAKNLHYTKALHLVRIVQEAISNSIKHANAKNIIIHSSVENGKWKILVTDDGAGFDHAAAKQLQLGNGLNNMEQRATDAGLIFSINSIKGGGTSVMITA